jgi:uncharacterized LabA/DUF88 family protein
MRSRNGKIALFIDGANLYATGRALGFDVDFKRLLAEFQCEGAVVRASYDAVVAQDFDATRVLLDWLSYNGYAVVTKTTKVSAADDHRRSFKGNMAIELAVDAMELAEHVDQIVLFSGDGEYRYLVEALQRRTASTEVDPLVRHLPLCVRVCPPDSLVHGGAVAATFRRQRHHGLVDMRRDRQSAVLRLLNPFPPSIEGVLDHHRSSRSPLKNGCRTLPSADFARYSISASSSGSTQMPRWAMRLL